jgi:hypothetical protein
MTVQSSVEAKFSVFRANHKAVNQLSQTDAAFTEVAMQHVDELQEAVQLLLEVETNLASMFGFSVNEDNLQKIDENFDYIWGRFASAEKSILDGKRDEEAIQEYLAGLRELNQRYFEIFGNEDGGDNLFDNLFLAMGNMLS